MYTIGRQLILTNLHMRNFFHHRTEKWHDFAPFLLRLVTGLIFLMHGWQKLTQFGVDGTAGFLTSLNFPAPEFFAVILIWVEILGGIALITGIMTRWAAKLLIINMIIALFVVHVSNGFFVGSGGVEFVLLLITSLTVIMIMGPGRWSVNK